MDLNILDFKHMSHKSHGAMEINVSVSTDFMSTNCKYLTLKYAHNFGFREINVIGIGIFILICSAQQNN